MSLPDEEEWQREERDFFTALKVHIGVTSREVMGTQGY
jgi:hypothetical protein